MSAPQKSVLIVDDDQVIREQLGEKLRRNYFEIYLASNGEEALELFEKSHIDIILLDIKLPDMDGLEVLRQVKENNPNCQVVVMTGYGSQDLAIQSLRSGAIDYIEKPLDMEQFKASIGRAEEKISQQEELSFRETILIVDDEPDVVKQLKRVLEREGYEVFGATSGSEGISLAEKNKVEVVVVDYRLGDMTGLEVFKRIREFYDDIEGIVITGHGKQEIAVKALRAGALDYLTKPLNLEELLFSVENAIERINLKRNRLYRQRELVITSEIKEKMNRELEQKVEERTKELKKTEAELFQTSKLATLGEMSAGLAHELNQPLGGIELAAEHLRKLKERDRLDEEALESALQDIEASVDRMSSVLKHVRTFARQDTLEFLEVEINETIENALELLGQQLRLHEIELVRNFNDNLPKIEGAPYQLEQVWINMISNARDALDEAEREKNLKKRLEIETDLLAENKGVVVRFKDNGIGIPEPALEKIFEPFFTTKEVGEATGLGLAISYGIIEEHEGDIEIESTPGDGTTVSVLLPLEQEDKSKI